VVSNVHSNQVTGALPENSFYAPNKEEIEEIMKGSESKKHVSGVQGYAEKVVRSILGSNPPARVFAGNASRLMWVFATFGWHTIWVCIWLEMIYTG